MKKTVISLLILPSAVALSQDVPDITYKPDPQVIRDVMLPPSRFGMLLFDLFEYQFSDEQELKYDVEFWYGGDFNRVWIELEGEHSLKEGAGKYERADIYYSRLISPFWDFRIGIGNQGIYGEESEDRTYLVAGFQGLAPYWFEVDANVRLDTEGNVTADLEAEIDFLFTQRLILQPRFETLISFSDIPELGIGSGISNIELGLRLRYEIRREFAPYIGVEWTQFFGKTKDYVEMAGEKTSFVNFLAGIRMWF